MKRFKTQGQLLMWLVMFFCSGQLYGAVGITLHSVVQTDTGISIDYSGTHTNFATPPNARVYGRGEWCAHDVDWYFYNGRIGEGEWPDHLLVQHNAAATFSNIVIDVPWSKTCGKPPADGEVTYRVKIIWDNGTQMGLAAGSENTFTFNANAATTFSNLTSIPTNDKAEPVTPFAGLILTDADSTAFTATIALDNAVKGGLSATSIVSGDLATVQAAIQAITFTPTQNIVAVGLTETTTITLSVTADGVTGTKSNTVVTTSMNDTPTDISLDSNTLNKTDAANTVVGNLSATDPDPSDTFTFALVSGEGDTNNNRFNINNAQLRANDTNMFPGSYSIRVKVTDASNAEFEKVFSITVADNVAPVITTSDTLNMINGSTTVATLAGTDIQDIDWSISGNGGDNDLFNIDPSTGALTLKDPANIGTKQSYTVTVGASDGTNTTTKILTIAVLPPVILHYQGFLATNTGAAVNETLSMTFKLYDALTDGEEVWSSTKDVVVTKGIYNVALGESVMLNDLDILNSTYYLGVSIESNNEMTPRQSIAPSGYIKILRDTKADKQ